MAGEGPGGGPEQGGRVRVYGMPHEVLQIKSWKIVRKQEAGFSLQPFEATSLRNWNEQPEKQREEPLRSCMAVSSRSGLRTGCLATRGITCPPHTPLDLAVDGTDPRCLAAAVQTAGKAVRRAGLGRTGKLPSSFRFNLGCFTFVLVNFSKLLTDFLQIV